MCEKPLHINIVDELKIGGAQTHLFTILREAIACYPYRHQVVSLFGYGPIGEGIRELGIPVDVFDIRPLLRPKRFFRIAGTLAQLFRQYRPHLAKSHLTWSRLLGLYAAWRVALALKVSIGVLVRRCL